MDKFSGYMHPGYADSLQEFGQPHELPRCKGWLLKREIPGFADYDAMGCYPLFVCQDWTHLNCDLEHMGSDLVSIALVTDPFGLYDETSLRDCFRDLVMPFKQHFVIDLQRPIVSAHHRYYARKALKSLTLEVCHNPVQFVDEWVALYDVLITRHNLKGIKAFSRKAFTIQLSIPGAVMVRAMHRGVPVAAHIWFMQGDVGYSHLEASSEEGYALGASYALYWFAIEQFSDGARWLDLGSGAGTKNDGGDGLSLFKRGWSPETRNAYFCGRIFDHKRYSEIAKANGSASTDYFPVYRKGELG
jgi:Acetyltransferase (GNAT) domain